MNKKGEDSPDGPSLRVPPPSLLSPEERGGEGCCRCHHCWRREGEGEGATIIVTGGEGEGAVAIVIVAGGEGEGAIAVVDGIEGGEGEGAAAVVVIAGDGREGKERGMRERGEKVPLPSSSERHG